MAKSVGEEAFAQAFQFEQIVPEDHQEEVRDFLYKMAHNLREAHEYLEILKQIDDINYDLKSELLFRTQAMALQCFPLAMRRMTDNSSERSLQKLIEKVVNDEFRQEEVSKIKEIHSHYKQYLDKGVAHQDKPSIHESLAAFPDTEIIEADMKHLENLYYKIVNEICSSYINITVKPHDYSGELTKLIITE